jgi:hypothetical protein
MTSFEAGTTRLLLMLDLRDFSRIFLIRVLFVAFSESISSLAKGGVGVEQS